MHSHTPPIPTAEKLYVTLACLFVSILVLTNVVGTKLFTILADVLPHGFFGSPLVLTAGIITYPLTFWFTDIVSELWGKRRADLMVIIGFGASMLMLIVLQIAKSLAPADIWTISAEDARFFHPDLYLKNDAGVVTGVRPAASQAAYAFTFDAPGTLLFASMLAYLTAQLLDNYLFHFWKRVTRGKYLWIRNNGSTMISQLADTAIVNSIFLHFYWQMPSLLIAQVIVTNYVFKIAMAVLDTPFIYLGVYLLRKRLEPATVQPTLS